MHNITSTRVTHQSVWSAQVYKVSWSNRWPNWYIGRYKLQEGKTSWGSPYYTTIGTNRSHLYRAQSGRWALVQGRSVESADMMYMSSEGVGESSPPSTHCYQLAIAGNEQWDGAARLELRVEAECLWSPTLSSPLTQFVAVTGFQGQGCYELQAGCTNWGSPYYTTRDRRGYFLYQTTDSSSWALGVSEGGVKELRTHYTSFRLDSGWREFRKK